MWNEPFKKMAFNEPLTDRGRYFVRRRKGLWMLPVGIVLSVDDPNPVIDSELLRTWTCYHQSIDAYPSLLVVRQKYLLN
jgi:hypothetical protein